MTSTPPDSPTDSDPVDRIAAAVLAVPGVVRLHGGISGAVATYLPGRRVDGVRLGEGRSEVHVALADGTTMLTTAARIRTAVAAVRPGPVDVHIDDLADDLPDEPAAHSDAVSVSEADPAPDPGPAGPPVSATAGRGVGAPAS